jgi:hypothetical protein
MFLAIFLGIVASNDHTKKNECVLITNKFVNYVKTDNYIELIKMIPENNRYILDYNIKTGRGISYIIKNMEIIQSETKIKRTDANTKTMIVTVFAKSPDGLANRIDIPEKLIKNGIDFVLKKEKGNWKVDFTQTEMTFSFLAIDSGIKFQEKMPKWFPLLPGNPNNINVDKITFPKM